MIDVDCYLCNHSQKTYLLSQRGDDPYLALVLEHKRAEELAWYACSHCGLVYRSPRLDASESATLYRRYDHDVMRGDDPDAYFDRITGLPDTQSENAQKIDWLLDALHRHGGGNVASMRVLDVGCGGGTLLYTFCEKSGVAGVFGVELNPVYANLAARRLSADIRCQSYETGLFGHEFDLVINTKVLEHVADPLPFLASMRQDLAPNGLLFLEVPDVCDFYNLAADDPRFYIPHVYFYSANTIRALFEQAGLKIAESRVIVSRRGRSYLQVVAKRRGSSTGTAKPPYDDASEIAANVGKRIAEGAG